MMLADQKKLIDSILLQAKYFLQEAGEFYPFGSCMDKDGGIHPMGVYFGEDHPSVSKVIDEFEKGTKMKQQIDETQIVAMGVDVYLRVPDTEQKKSAVQIRFYEKGKLMKLLFVPYEISNSSSGSPITFDEAFEEKLDDTILSIS